MILELHASPEEVMRAVETLQEFGRERQVTEKDLFGLALALEECGSNIVNHALQRDPQRKFQVVIEHANGAMTLELRDPGPPFDPTVAPGFDPVENENEDREPGGWGISLVRHYVDEIRYQRELDQNVLRLTKRLSPGLQKK
jgi:anti-sigma regulatory factor (Ser/Thr protein kinase)